MKKFHVSCLVNSADLGQVLGTLQEINVEILDCRLVVNPTERVDRAPPKQPMAYRNGGKPGKQLAGRRKKHVLSCHQFVEQHVESLPAGTMVSRKELMDLAVAAGYSAANANTAVQDVYRRSHLIRIGNGQYRTRGDRVEAQPAEAHHGV